MSSDEVRIPRWVLGIVITIVLGVIGKGVWWIWTEHIESFKQLDRVVDTLAREFKGE